MMIRRKPTVGQVLLSIEALAKDGNARGLENLLADERVRSSVELRTGVVSGLGRSKSPFAYKTLVELLKDRTEHRDVRLMAARALGELGDSRAVPALTEVLQEDWVALQVRVAVSLAQIGDIAGLESLLLLTRHTSATVRSHAAEGLGRFPDQRAVAQLVDCLSDPTRKVRIFAAKALGRIGNDRALEALKTAGKREGFLTRGVITEAASQLESRLAESRRPGHSGENAWRRSD
jgi:HEAT repeat protein